MYNKKDHKFDNISENEYSVFLSLIENQNLIIQKADEGNNIVILNKEDYIEKLEEILSDEDKFEKATFEENKANKELRYILNMEETIKQTLDHFRRKNYITQNDYDKLAPSGGQPGILYGLAKIHKVVIVNCPPCRPILNAINTPTYKIAKFLVLLLEPVTSNTLC